MADVAAATQVSRTFEPRKTKRPAEKLTPVVRLLILSYYTFSWFLFCFNDFKIIYCSGNTRGTPRREKAEKT